MLLVGFVIDCQLFPHEEEYPDDTKLQFSVYILYICWSLDVVIC